MLDIVRREILKHYSHHIASSFSCVEILKVLYDEILTENDVLILSKGHAAPALDTILMMKGIIDEKDMPKYGIHCDFNCSGVPFTTGSLGCGIGLGAGVALAKKLKKEDGWVYVLCGDGEITEGSAQESISFAVKETLNMTVMVDCNGFGSTSRIVDTGRPLTSCFDGHDEYEITKALHFPGILKFITTKSKGIDEWEGDVLAHSKTVSRELKKRLLK